MSALPTHGHSTAAETATRTNTNVSDDVIPDEDGSEVTKLFSERLTAYKHACGYLEDYVSSIEKVHKENHKEFEKALKNLSHPIKEADHFERGPGGIQGMLEALRTQTQSTANSNSETAKLLKGSVLSIFERLHSEIKAKNKDLTKGAGKGSKAVDKARSDTQKHIELLGKNVAAHGVAAGGVKAADDPYILHRQVKHRLHKQVLEENNNRADLLEVQNSFAQFEAHIIQTFQQGMQSFQQIMSKQGQAEAQSYNGMVQTIGQVQPNFEWNSFLHRRGDVLIDPSTPARSVDNINFPNQNAPATQPLIAGALDRKGKILKKYDTAYWVVTPSKYLHEFKTDDDFAKDPSPETSLYLPDCTIGGLDGLKFAVKGKDASSKLSLTSHELQFKAHSISDAAEWHRVISQCAGSTTTEKPEADDDYTTGSSTPVVGQQPVGTTTGLQSEATHPSAGSLGTDSSLHNTSTLPPQHTTGTESLSQPGAQTTLPSHTVG